MPWRPSSNSNTSRNGAPSTGSSGFGRFGGRRPEPGAAPAAQNDGLLDHGATCLLAKRLSSG